MAEEKVFPTEGTTEEQVTVSFLTSIVNDIVNSPLNLMLVGVITILVYKIFRSRQQPVAPPPEPELPRLRKDFTVTELRQFDGTQPDGRVLVAVNGSVYDVTKGKRFYGPGGPYAAFGGRDASRGLATFSVTSNEKEEYDDLSDLSAMEMESVREWEMQFKEKYILVGRLLKPGEQPTNYSDEDDDTPNEATPTAEPAASAKASAGEESKTSKPAEVPAAAAAPASPKPDSKSDATSAANDDGDAAPSKAEDVKSGGDAKAKDE
ncbi:membrane-associated progesterone receptor component 1-like [Sabethes cyaneus]|uniref:membrane-associated progesterone receptor component 1-like n=1 Tax=Sabethes cyaneus TaxID=53552 RepID=UPI00221E371F|nr:membrane-associated progesterone receptor component 1-like [Sabethes cyaneus]